MEAIVTLGVVGIILLLPVQFLELPLNVSLADVWGLVALPLCWAWLLKARHPVRLPYLTAMIVIALATSLSSMTSPEPLQGMIVLMRELYLYFWFATLAAVFAAVDESTFRKLLVAWCAATLANGAVILAQFVSPSLLDSMNAAAAGLGYFGNYRPSGLLANSNAAGMFQVMGFVPLIVLRLHHRKTLVIGATMFATVMATGSMGAILALLVGIGAALLITATVLGNWKAATQFAFRSFLAASLILALFMVLGALSPVLREHLDSVFLGRGDRSAQSRFDLWNRGFEILMSRLRPWGIGPDQFARVTWNEAHNDLLSFAVERGLLGLLGLVLFAFAAMRRALSIAGVNRRVGDWAMVVFPAALAAIFVESQTHEVFHMRPVWLGLALQESMLGRWRSASTGAVLARPPQGPPALLESQRPLIT